GCGGGDQVHQARIIERHGAARDEFPAAVAAQERLGEGKEVHPQTGRLLVDLAGAGQVGGDVAVAAATLVGGDAHPSRLLSRVRERGAKTRRWALVAAGDSRSVLRRAKARDLLRIAGRSDPDTQLLMRGEC